jgi:SAM-dependent methyltransferase
VERDHHTGTHSLEIPRVNDTLKILDGLFQRTLSSARSIGPLTPAGRGLLQLCALRFLAAMGARKPSHDSWLPVTEALVAPVDAAAKVESTLLQVADEIETNLPQLRGVFRNHLIANLRGSEDLLAEWIDKLTPMGADLRKNAQAFGRWFDATVDDSIGRGIFGLQYATPRSVIDLMVELAAPQPGERIHDPSCGSGGVLAGALAWLTDRGEASASDSLSGQEANAELADMAQLRLYLLGGCDVRVRPGDALRHPLFVKNNQLEKFDVVLCIPPVGQRRAREFARSDPYDRFKHGQPGRASSDTALLQHATACLNENGRAVLLIPHGPLFRGGADAKVRAGIVKEDLLEAVIGLPTGILPGVSMEVAIVVCRRRKPDERRDHVLFVDASDQGVALRNSDISEIFRRMSDQHEPTVAHLAPLAEIETNGFALQPRLYVRREDRSNPVDIEASLAQAAEYEREAALLAKRIEELIEALGKKI